MKNTRLLIYVVIAAVLAACSSSQAPNTVNITANTAVANSGTTAGADRTGMTDTVPTVEMLVNFDKLWHEAYSHGNSDFFVGVLDPSFVMLADDGTRLNKAAALKAIAGVKCTIASTELTEPLRTVIDADTYAVSYKASIDGTCSSGQGVKVIKLPGPVRAATVWVRAPGDNWRVAFHGENLIVDPNGKPKAVAPARPADAASLKADAVTGELVAAETSIAQAWKDNDNAKLDAMLAPGLGFVDLFGTAYATKADVLKNWTESGCDIKSVSVNDGAGVSLSPNLAVLTAKGTSVGTCSGQQVGSEYVTSFYVKEGSVWKLAFGFNAPSP